MDLEHWAAFQTSFTRLSTLVTEVASGRSSRVLIQALYFARVDNNTLLNVLF